MDLAEAFERPASARLRARRSPRRARPSRATPPRSSCSTSSCRTATASSCSRSSARRGTARLRHPHAVDRGRGRAIAFGASEPAPTSTSASRTTRLRRREGARAARARAASKARDERPTVLVIDDSLTFREALRRRARGRGLRRPRRRAAARRGCASPPSRRPRGIVVDGVLPGIDGATVIRRLRLDAALRDARASCSPAPRIMGAELRALDAGADAFVRKDEDIDVVLARLGAALRAERRDRGQGRRRARSGRRGSSPSTTARPTCTQLARSCARRATTSCSRAPARRRSSCSRSSPSTASCSIC